MDYHKLIIVLILISALLGILFAIKLLQKKNVLSSSFGKLSLRGSITLSKEASAHVVQYENFSFLITAPKNGSMSVLPLIESKEPTENQTNLTGYQQ